MNIVDHQNGNVLDIRLDVLNIAHKVEQLEDIHVLLLQPVMGVSRILAAVNDPTDGTFKESMYRVIELIERHKGVLVLVFDFLSSLLKARQHGALATRKVLARITVFADLCEYLLNDNKLIGDKGESRTEFSCAGKALDVQDRVIKGEKAFQPGGFLLILHLQKVVGILRLFQNTFFNDLINGRGRQAQAGIEAPLNLGKVVSSDLYDGINRFLTGNHDPNLATALVADFFNQRLQIHHQVAIVADVLPHLIHAEQEAEVSFLAVHILFNFGNKLLDAHVGVFFAVEPVAGCRLTHTENRL